MLTGITSKDPALLLNPSGMTVSENLRDGLTVSPFLTTTDSGIFVDPATQEQTPGTYVLGATATEPVETSENSQAATASQAQAQSPDGETAPEATLTVITAPSLIDGSLLQQFPSITNLTIFMNAASHNISQAVNLSIPAKSLEVTYNMITAGGLWSALFIIVIPVIFLIAGFVVWMKRRKL